MQAARSNSRLGRMALTLAICYSKACAAKLQLDHARRHVQGRGHEQHSKRGSRCHRQNG